MTFHFVCLGVGSRTRSINRIVR